MEKDFELLSHTADIKLRVYGKTLAEFFRNAVIGMFQSIGPQASGCQVVHDRVICPELPKIHQVTSTGQDLESLLVNFLSELLYLSDVHNEAYLDAIIQDVSQTHIAAVVHGVEVSCFEVVEIKAVTYHDLSVKKIDGLWQADIVFDI